MSGHGAVEIRLADKTRSYRLGLAEIEELEAELDLSIFLIGGALSSELPFLKVGQWKHVIRLGLIGGGMNRADADDLAQAMIEEHGAEMCAPIALRIVAAALGKVHSDGGDAASGEADAPRSGDLTSAPSTPAQS